MKEITLNHITKIEGHAKLALGIEKGTVTKCELGATEGARYFEGIVKNRKYDEAHELTSRICGICSCAHVTAALMAVEHALGVKPSHQTVELRNLLMLGERIRSHATHLYFLALPDYAGYESALAMAQHYQKELKDALQLMKLGNKMIRVLAARDLHPVSATVNGWLKLPKQDDVEEFAQELEAALPAAERTAKLFSGLTYPEFRTEAEFFSLVNGNEYAILHGTLSSGKREFAIDHYRAFITEYHEPYSTANFVVKKDKRYFVGAMARINNSHAHLLPRARKALKASPLRLPDLNSYHNNIAQAVELIHCIEHAAQICRTLKLKDEKPVKPAPRAGVGVAAIEVPRGTLWHEYTLDENGIITDANIITPTAQNLLSMQEDVRNLVPTILNKKKETMILDIEKLIRSYDPCFSCSAHFLDVTWD